ncbi:hypothetical protein DUNSADRAFT_10094, partial [Dunaliella salina]
TSMKLLVLYMYEFLLFVYTYFVVRRMSLGKSRLVAALPPFLGTLVLPLLLDPFNPSEALLISPLTKKKLLATRVLPISPFSFLQLLAFCVGRGPLTLPLTPAQFGTVLLIPIIPLHAQLHWSRYHPSSTPIAELIQAAMLIPYHCNSSPFLPALCRHWLYTLSTCLFLGSNFDILATAVILVLQMPVAPTFNQPWLSDSFADFWARRWNLTTTYMMRAMLYEPIMQGCIINPCISLSKAPQAPSNATTHEPFGARPEAAAVNAGTVSAAKKRKPISAAKSTGDFPSGLICLILPMVAKKSFLDLALGTYISM